MNVQGYFRILSLFDVSGSLRAGTLNALLGPEAAPRSPGFVLRTPEYAQPTPPFLETTETNRTLERNFRRIKFIGLESPPSELITAFRLSSRFFPQIPS